MTVYDDLIDRRLADYQKPEQAEFTHHLGYHKHCLSGNNSGNSRNGRSA
jgi:hypothetical protein